MSELDGEWEVRRVSGLLGRFALAPVSAARG
jgi:hypothetical protein